MDEATKNEYDFFMRAAALFHAKAQALAPLAESPRIEDVIKAALDDADHATVLARVIAEGYVLVNRDRLPAEERGPVDVSQVSAKYR